jgi:glutathione S-transferase
MLTLYHSTQSRSTRMLWLLEEIGEPYKIQYVTIRRGDGTGGADAKNIHPEGKVPALMHDGRLVRESGAICLYLTDSFPQAGLGPTTRDEKRADYLYWLFNYAAEVEPSLIARMMGSGDNPAWKRSYEESVARLTKQLQAGDYLLGSRFSAADILFVSVIQWMRRQFPEDAVYDRYVDRCIARPAFARANAKDKPSA